MAGVRVDRRRRFAKHLGNSCRYADVAKPNRGSVQRSLAVSREARAEEAGPSNACMTDVQRPPIGVAEQVIVEHDNGPRSRESSQNPASQSPRAASTHGSPSGTSTGIVVGDSKDMRFFGPSAWVPPGFSDLTHGQSTPQHAPKQAFPSKESWSRWTHPLPSDALEDDSGILQATDGSKINTLRVQAQFALIQASISRELSSVTGLLLRSVVQYRTPGKNFLGVYFLPS
ncbi:Fungal-trans domain-containing protein [Fusarium keratoplasticum]|nr:Fungal-trans domain-containing protein [Fusarium keratoplasticum]